MIEYCLYHDEVGDFELTQRQEGERLFLKVKGWAGHSSAGPQAVLTAREGTALLIRVPLTDDPDRKTQWFELEFEVPADVTEVRWLPDNLVLWARADTPSR